MNSTKKVSVIIITYNHVEYIAEAISSAIAQDYVNKEIIVSDDGSTDGTQVIVSDYAAKYPGLVIPVLSPVNTGIAANFNRGLAQVTGDYIAWLGGDDVMLQGKLTEQALLLSDRADAVGCYHDAEVFEWPSGKVLGLFSELYGAGRGRAPDIGAASFLNPKTQMLPSAMMVRRERIPEGGFDTRLRIANDYLFDFLTLAEGGCFAGTDKTLVRYRKHLMNVGRQSKWGQLIFEEKLMALAAIDARYPRYARATWRRRQYYALEEALKCLRAGDRKRFGELCTLAAQYGAFVRASATWLVGPFVVRILYGEQGQRIRHVLRKVFF